MFKANGREKRSDTKEYAEIKGKTFICPECESTRVLSGTEFGEQIKCTQCNKNMIEKS